MSMFIFGLVMTLQGLGMFYQLPTLPCLSTYSRIVKNYSGLLATRFFLGLAETGVTPGCEFGQAPWPYPYREI